MTTLGIGTGGALAPPVEELVSASRGSAARRLTGREAITEGVLGCTFLAAGAIAAATISWERPLEAWVAVLLVVLFAAASRVRLEDGAGYTVPTQIIFVPMLYFLPCAVVPLVVAAGTLLGNAPDYLARRKHPTRALLSFGDSWHAVGPALVFALGAPGDPDLGDWPLLLAALGAQFALDFVVSVAREWIGLGISPRLQPRLLAWVYMTDACMAPIGLFVALVAVQEPVALLLLMPIGGLLLVYASEREQRIGNALELSQAYRGTARLLGDVVSADDAYTGSHSRSVVELSLRVADRLRVGAHERRTIEFAALLHDVGKIAIPKEIVNKPGPLTGEEWVVMRTHTLRGQELLDRVGGLLGEVGQIVRASHERFDGNGYPDGLAGSAIPLAARIVSCCDAFNAMTTARAYRSPMSEGAALRELVDNAGTQFDPKVVRTLIALLRRPSTTGLPRLASPQLERAAATASSQSE